jgi:hypothetical protein
MVTSNNKRQYERIPFNEEATLILPQPPGEPRRLAGYAGDGGFGGYLFQPNAPEAVPADLAIGAPCQIELDLFGRKERMDCTVVRLNQQGIGLQLRRAYPAPVLS